MREREREREEGRGIVKYGLNTRTGVGVIYLVRSEPFGEAAAASCPWGNLEGLSSISSSGRWTPRDALRPGREAQVEWAPLRL
jgi:hypothetical protein